MKKSKIIVVTALALITALTFGGCKKTKENKTEEKENKTKVTESVDEKKEDSEAKTDEKDTAAKDDKSTGEKKIVEESVSADMKEEKVYKPTFMYFVSSNDPEHESNMEVVKKLQKEYKDTVVFDIKNVDEDPELLKNFEIVKGQTPTLIMQNTKNEISNFLFKNGNYDDLKATIDAALQ